MINPSKPHLIAKKLTAPLSKIGVTFEKGSKADAFVKQSASKIHTGLKEFNSLQAKGEAVIADLKSKVHAATAPTPPKTDTPKKPRRPAPSMDR